MSGRNANFEWIPDPRGFAGGIRPLAPVYEIQPRDNHEAIAAGLRFLCANRKAPHWLEFAGVDQGSDVWITAVVVAELSAIPAQLLTPDIHADLRVSTDWLLSLQNQDSGWGFKAGENSDAESTAWAMLALRGQNRAIPAQAMDFIHSCRSTDGGIGLYPAESVPRKAARRGKPDVSALVMRALDTVDASAEEFLKIGWIQTNRPLPAARLQSRFYTCALLLEWESLPQSWPMLEKLCALMSLNRAENAFDQALLLRCLTRLRIQKASSVSAGLRRLQQVDGGWPSSASQVTVSGTETPGAVCLDDQRVLTTVAAIAALARFAQAQSAICARKKICGKVGGSQ
jgi:hypothetical protein